MSHWALLCSPFLGPQVWQPVVVPLQRLGHRATVVSASGDSPAAVLDGLRSGLPVADDLVLVPHSNAGLYVAALAAGADVCGGSRSERASPAGPTASNPAVSRGVSVPAPQGPPSVSGVVFVDALLPGEGDRTRVAPASMLEQLASLVQPDGLLPVWTRWWPDADLDGLFPSPAARAKVEAGQARMPLGYLQSDVLTPPGWEQLPCGYLGFGDTYADEQVIAGKRGWPVDAIPGRHLHQVVDPDAVAHRIIALHARAVTLR
ncbi:MAG: hypothetical protein ACR2FG_06540 [Marmoricola sp.]